MGIIKKILVALCWIFAFFIIPQIASVALILSILCVMLKNNIETNENKKEKKEFYYYEED